MFDLIVIGAGPGGYVAAIRATKLKLKVGIIEKHKPGGVCLNIGCIPSKTLIHNAELIDSLPEISELGIKFDKSNFDYSKVFNKSRDISNRLSKSIESLIKSNKIEYIKGEAKISSNTSVTVNQKIYSTKHIIIATGSRPIELPNLKTDGEYILNSNHILMLQECPKSLIIVGSGAIGIEFAYIMSSFGTEVTIIDVADKILPSEDSEISKILHSVYTKRGIKILTSASITHYKIDKGNNKITAKIKQGSKLLKLEANKILVSIGREPNTQNLGIEKLGITINNKNFIETNNQYQTNINNIYAIGDIINTPLLAHTASKEGEIAVDSIINKKLIKPLNYSANPSAIYSNPQIASFGLKFQEAKNLKYDCKELKFPYYAIGKMTAINKTTGIIKIIVNNSTKEILGTHIIGYNATEIIHEILLAYNSELLIDDIIELIHLHPTVSEVVSECSKLDENLAIHL